MQTYRMRSVVGSKGTNTGKPFLSYKRRSHRYLHRPALQVNAFSGDSFMEIKLAAEKAKQRAEELLPQLEQAQHIVQTAREPAAEAERRWQEQFTASQAVQSDSHEALDQLRHGAIAALGGAEKLTISMLQHHVDHRLDTFLNQLPNIKHRQSFPPTTEQLSWLPGSTMVSQLAACFSENNPYVVACISIAATPLEADAIRSIMLHWGVSDSRDGQWLNAIPQGWHTSPSVSQPFGTTAWGTSFSSFAPVLNGELTSSIEVFSVVVQIPFQQQEALGGLKYVLKRTDGGQPEWIKPWHNSDFFLDFLPVKDFFEYQRQQSQLLGMQAALDAVNDASSLGSMDDWAAMDGIGNYDGISSDWEDQTARTATDNSTTTVVEKLPDVLYSFDEEDDAVVAIVSQQENNQHGEGGEVPAAVEEQPKQPEIALLQWEPPQFDATPTGWLTHIERWETTSADHPPQMMRSLGKQLQHLKAVLAAAAKEVHHENTTEGGDNEAQAATIRELLQRCEAVEDTLHHYDSAAFAARVAQQEKEKLWEAHKEASHQAAHLQQEIESALDTARRATVALKGRATEVTVGDLEGLCYQLAAEDKKNTAGFWPFAAGSSRKMVFISQKEMRVSGLSANLVSQVYLEGPAAAVDALLARNNSSENNTNSTESSGGESEDEAAKEAKKERKPVLDTIVIAVSAGEEFPDGGFSSRLLLHYGCVAHSGAQWKQPPAGWKSKPEPLNNTSAGTTTAATTNDEMPWCPFQSYTMAGPDGSSPVLIDPEMHGLVIKLPLKDCVLSRIKGIEFVLQTRDDRWLSWDKGHGSPSNFYVELPVPGR